MTSEQPTFADLLAAARPAERSIPLCLRGDLVAQYEELDRQRIAAQSAAGDSLAGSPAVAVARAMDDLRATMVDSTVTFKVRALGRRAYRELTAAHPPRRDAEGAVVEDDAGHDVDTTTFWGALLRASIIEPKMTPEQADHLLDDLLTDRQYEQLALLALAVNRGAVDVPFSPAASQLLTTSGGGSNAPNGSASLSDASTAGNPPPATSTTSTDD